MQHFNVSSEICTLGEQQFQNRFTKSSAKAHFAIRIPGLTLYVLGFAFGPLICAKSEDLTRRAEVDLFVYRGTSERAGRPSPHLRLHVRAFRCTLTVPCQVQQLQPADPCFNSSSTSAALPHRTSKPSSFAASSPVSSAAHPSLTLEESSPTCSLLLTGPWLSLSSHSVRKSFSSSISPEAHARIISWSLLPSYTN